MNTPIVELTAPELAHIEEIARHTLATIPAPFAEAAQSVVLRVEDLASEQMLKDLQIADPFELTGMYDGIPLTEKSVFDQVMQPDTIWLFRRAILDEWCARGDVSLRELVAHVTVHELAHHFGWSDDDIAVIDRWWE